MPQSMNHAVNSMISFVCGIQFSTFSTFHGKGMATTMCTGNLRSATQNLCGYIRTKDMTKLRTAGMYFGCIAVFIAGALIGNLLTVRFGEKAAMAGAGVLVLPLVMMFSEKTFR
jgi:uncharacterized membrane protein YoaK (UPF0700 family)